MGDAMEKARQLMDVMACDLRTAQRALQQSNGDVDQAVDAFLSGTMNTGQDSSSHGWDAAPGNVPSLYTPAGASEAIKPLLAEDDSPAIPSDQASWADRANEGVRRSERNVRKRNSPIDLTADDDDEDLRKAMQASLESETNRQKRHQEYGIGPALPARPNAHGVSADDEALTRAIEASMLQSRYSTREQSPQISANQLESMGANRIRSDGEPVAVVAPLPFMHLFASVLQALHASSPFRQAITSARFVDIRSRQQTDSQMDDYWRGISPAGVARPSAELWEENEIAAEMRENVDTLMRLSTLFTFLAYTKRSFVLADDIITHSPLQNNYAYVMNSERKPSHDIFSCYVQGLLDSLAAAAPYLEKAGKINVEADQFKSSFQSFTVNAIEPEEAEKVEVQPQPGEAYEVVVSTLNRSSANNTVHRALHSLLADERTLISKLGQTLFFCIGQVHRYNSHLEAPSTQTTDEKNEVPFTLETQIYLDAFTFEKQNGVRLGLVSENIKQSQRRIEELERYRKSIATFQGDDTRTLLRSSLKYMATLHEEQSNSDPLRSSNILEAGPRLEAILAHLEQEITSVDGELEKLKKDIDDSQTSTLAAFEEELAKKENQRMVYDLQAAIFEDDESSYTYVRVTSTDGPRQQWWRIRASDSRMVTEEDVLQDKSNLTFIVYTAAEDVHRTRASQSIEDQGEQGALAREALDRAWWSQQALVHSIDHDNANFTTTSSKVDEPVKSFTI